MSTAAPVQDPQQQRVGVLYGLACYGWWGVVLVYFKLIKHVPPLELLAHRVGWSLVLLAALMAWRGRWSEALGALRHPRLLGTLLITTALIAGNWFTFLWAVLNDQVVQASLGYFINPMVNVILGFVFLRERLRPIQWLAVGLAAIGVVVMTVHLGELPLVALILAVSFGFYGLLRKTAAVDSMVGLSLETLLLLPVAAGYLLWLFSRDDLMFTGGSVSTDLLLIGSGAVTALPLLWFAHAARRLTLSTIGLLQYIAPSFQLTIGVVIYGEAFTRGHAIAFAFIWTGLAIYTWDSLRRQRNVQR